MKKNITINMFGVLYSIDEDAYELLNRYFESMKSYFSRREGGDEIVDDIENRVAELLWQKKSEGVEAVDIDVIRSIISRIGDAAEIDSAQADVAEGKVAGGDSAAGEGDCADEAEGSQETARWKTAFGKYVEGLRRRRLYRDSQDKMLGGVCSGLSSFFRIGSPAAWRLVTVLLVIFFNIFLVIAYAVVWIIVPCPATPEDRLMMRGEDVSPENLNKEILRENTTESAPCVTRKNGGCLLVLLKILIVILTLPVAACGCVVVFFMVVMLSAIFGFMGSLFPYWSEAEFSFIPQMLFGHSVFYFLGLIACLLVAVVPLYALVRFARKVGNPESSNRRSRAFVLVAVWVVSLGVAIAALSSFGMEFQKKYKIERARVCEKYGQVESKRVSLGSVSFCVERFSDEVDGVSAVDVGKE